MAADMMNPAWIADGLEQRPCPFELIALAADVDRERSRTSAD
jgi:hypothetical protein